MVTVTNGANSDEFPSLAGRSVSEVRIALAGLYNISPDATASVNGEAVDGSFILSEDDNLSFNKALAKKGI